MRRSFLSWLGVLCALVAAACHGAPAGALAGLPNSACAALDAPTSRTQTSGTAAEAMLRLGAEAALDLSLAKDAAVSSGAAKIALRPNASALVRPSLFGVNTLFFHEKDPLRADPRYQASLAALTPTFMRYPGGTAADNYLWETNSLHSDQWFPFRYDPDQGMETSEFLEFSKRHGAKPLMVINYRSFAQTGDMEACCRNAEQWVRLVNRPGQPPVDCWEFGNELYFAVHGVDPEHYGAAYRELRKRLNKADPRVRLGLVMANYWDDRPGLVPGYNRRAIGKLDRDPDFIVLHFYPSLTEESFFQRGMAMRERIRSFRAQLQQHGVSPGVPIFVTEWNVSAKSSKVAGQTIGHLCALAQGFVELTDAGVCAATLWPLQHSGTSLLQRGSCALAPAGQMVAWLNAQLAGWRKIGLQQSPKLAGTEIAAFLSPQATMLRILAVNRSPREPRALRVAFGKLRPSGEATLQTLLSANAAAGREPDINDKLLAVNRQRLGADSAGFVLPPMSVSALEIPLQAPRAATEDRKPSR